MIARLMVVMACLLPCPAAGQGARHLLVVSGLSGEPAYAAQFAAAAHQLTDSARTRWNLPAGNITWLAEDPGSDRRRIAGRATRESVAAAFAALQARAQPADEVIVVLIGHGSGEDGSSRIALPGPDPTANDYAGWLDRLAVRRVVVIVAASGSGDFLPVLSRPGRVVITATKSATERNASVFAVFIATALSTDEGDADKDGTTTLLEAYHAARSAVAASYATRNTLLTEHAMLDDNGDKIGTAEPGRAAGGDGAVARQFAVSRVAMASTSPRVAVLIAERTALEQQLEQLRLRRSATDSAAYQREFERLLLEIAARTRDILAIPPGSRP